jgi:hypothetical protein
MLAFQKIKSAWNNPASKAVFYPLLSIALLINLGGLVMMSFKPAMYGNVNMIQYIEKHYKTPVNLYAIAWSNPYSEGPYKGLNARFYRNPNVEIKDLSAVLYSSNQEVLTDRDLIILQAGYSEREWVEAKGFALQTQSIPSWIEKMNQFYKVYPSYKTLLLYSKPDRN